MTLAPGTRLGPYEILALIGVGGMGEVYRAHDTKLVRDVALKVLPAAYARDPARLARFRREARLLASLNHPNIAAIYGLEDEGDKHYLVMELVLGDTLRDQITRDGAAPVEEALTICKQIAAALEHAHEKTIIHRDLKPANVKVTPEGQVKVLDFGLAKAFAAEESEEDIHNAPTVSASPTIPGAILGTPAYMSPEQAKGKKVDRRTDIWAFGCVLYELLTGKRAYEGETVTEILASVLKGEPDWSALPADTPSNLRFLLRRCLQKDATKRFHAAADFRIEIEEALSAWAISAPAVTTQTPKLWRQALPWAAGLMLSVIVGIAAWHLKPAPPQPVSRFAVALPPDMLVGALDGSTVTVSPDGTQLAYVARRGSLQQLYLRSLESLEAKPIPGTQLASSPFFSPDGQWLGFFAGSLKKVSVSGGAVLTLTKVVSTSRGANWGPNDTIVFAPGNADGLWQVPAAGGEPQELTALKEGETSHRWPQFLPDGKSVLFTVGVGGSYDDAHIAVQRLDTAEHQVLIRGGTYARYVPTGHLVYYRAGTMFAVPFDPVRLEVMGTPTPVLEGVMSSTSNTGVGQFSFSSLGSLVYVPGPAQGQAEHTLVWVGRNGTEQPLRAPARFYPRPRLSPDGRRLAIVIEGPQTDVWIYDISRETLTRLTFEGGNSPIWTPDGKRITFDSPRFGPQSLFWKPADGSGAEQRLLTNQYPNFAQDRSPDSQVLAYLETHPKTSRDIWVLPLQGERKPRSVLQTPFDEGAPMFSPDGRWLAYTSDESGRYEVYVQPFPGPGGKWQISTEGGREPIWAPNGRELFYRNEDKMLVVDITTAPSFSASKPSLLFEERYEIIAGIPRPNYDVTPDGQRFLMVKASQQELSAAQIHVVLNWFEELKRRVPSGQ